MGTVVGTVAVPKGSNMRAAVVLLSLAMTACAASEPTPSPAAARLCDQLVGQAQSAVASNDPLALRDVTDQMSYMSDELDDDALAREVRGLEAEAPNLRRPGGADATREAMGRILDRCADVS